MAVYVRCKNEKKTGVDLRFKGVLSPHWQLKGLSLMWRAVVGED